jgi:hypothetical protein
MEYKSILGFNGINRNVSPFITEIGDLLDLQNFSAEKIGVLKKSFDYTQKGGQLVDNAEILGAIDFFRNDGTHEHIVAVDGASNSDIFKYVTDTWTAQSQNLTAGYKVRFAYNSSIDTLFAANYADTTRSYDGSSWSTTENVTDAPKAKIAISFGERIYLLNCVVGSTSYPSRAYRSSAIETSATWDADDYFAFNDVIIGAGLNMDSMFVVCEGSTHILTLDDQKYQMSLIGGVSHESIVSFGRYTFYAARDGYYAFDGRETFKISLPIQEFWAKIPEANFADIQAVVKGDHIYIYVGDITAPWDSTETLQNVVFDYNITQNNWHRGKLGADCTNLHLYVTDSGEEVFFGDNDGFVYEMFDGSGQQDGSDYQSHIETYWIYGSGSGQYDDFKEFWGYGNYLSGLKVSYKTEEREHWVPIGELNNDVDCITFNKRAYKIKFRLSEYSGKNLFEVEKFDVGYMPVEK